MKRRRAYHEEQSAYLEMMRQAFAGHYAAGTDVWSQDDSLLKAARIAHALWCDHNEGQRPNALDIGCGNGRALRAFDPQIKRYLGVDLCEHPEWAGMQAGSFGAVEFVIGDFVKWSADQAGGQFDLVLDHGCFHHQHPSDHATCLQGVAKLLVPGGIFSLVVWAESWKEENIGEDGRFHLPFTLEQIESMIEQAGLSLLQVEEVRAKVGTNQYHAIACKPKGGVK